MIYSSGFSVFGSLLFKDLSHTTGFTEFRQSKSISADLHPLVLTNSYANN